MENLAPELLVKNVNLTTIFYCVEILQLNAATIVHSIAFPGTSKQIPIKQAI